MNRTYGVLVIIISFYLTACRESNPVSENEIMFPVSRCYIAGLEIRFADTCSYKFVTNFMSTFDSVVVQSYSLGSNFYLYADSGDYNYWVNYFKNDLTIQNIFKVNSTQDSLIVKLRLSGKKSIEEEKLRFLGIKHLEVIKIEEQQKQVFVKVPENTESTWEYIFKQYAFVSEVLIIGVCLDS